MYNDSIAQNRDDEVSENEDYKQNKKKMRGHSEDSRFDEGSTDHDYKIVRPMSHMSPKNMDYLGKMKNKVALNNGHIKTDSQGSRSSYQPEKVKGRG